MPELKTACHVSEYKRDAKEYVINMLGKKRKLHIKNGCCHSKCFFEYYTFETLEEVEASGIEFTKCRICFPEERGKK